ncbi:MAG: hypothetical protein QM495_10010 [Lutibacter sp.]|uniref:hypothetical protein n=1 Tax=Lutibacter sp. TaxID=1925666 RepID=UPI00385C52E9
MKKLLLLLLLIGSTYIGYTQNNSYANRMQHIFGNIDKAKVTTGYLKEFGIRLNEIETYNGIINSNNFVDKTQWQSLYSSLYTMRIGSVALNMADPNTIFTNLKTQQNNTEDVLFAVQYYNYQQYKTNAYTNGDVTVSNDRIFDVAGRNPYDTKNVFAVTPLKLQLQGDTFAFKLPSNLLYTNTGENITQIQIDFDDGQGYQTITLNTSKNITYSVSGEKELKYKFTHANGSIKYSHSKIWVDYVASQNHQARFNGNINDILFNREPITGEAWQGASATGFVTVELAEGHTKLTKPLIVIEGFDPDNSFNYYNLIYNFNPFGTSVGTFDVKINATGLTLNQAIEDEGYDLVFVNYANGTDYIQRNAYMVEEVIRWVNTQKTDAGSTEKNVVLGMSMGGLVGRYALRHMELNGEIHDTKLYISHDSPHQGANVPLSVQAFVRHLYGEEISIPIFFSLIDFDIIDIPSLAPDLNTGYDLLQSPAAQQMLIYQLNGAGNNISINNNTLSTTFYNEYHSMGNPTQNGIRNIAIANGSECGNSLNFSDNATLINVNETIDLPWYSNFALAFINLAGWNPLKSISSVLSTNTDIKLRFNAKGLPNQEAKQIYNGQIFISKTILGLFTVHEPLIDEKRLNSSSTMLAMDNASGGIYDIENFADLPNDFDEYILQRKFNFIPTYSSLNISGGNQTINPTDLNKTYSPLSPPLAPRNSYFDNFYTNPLSSEGHTQFTLKNGNWLLEELKDSVGFYSCASTCSNDLPLRISGSEQVCFSNSATYNLNNVNESLNIVWNVSPSGGFILTSNGTSATITPNGNFDGTALLTASISSNCGQVTVPKTLKVGNPSFPNKQMTGESNPFTGDYEQYSVPTASGALNYDWYFDVGGVLGTSINGWEIVLDQGGTFVNIKVGNPGLAVLVCKATNSCGGTTKYKYITAHSTSGGGGSGTDPCLTSFKFSSNPMKSGVSTNKVIIIEEPCLDPAMKNADTTITNHTITIFNRYSTMVYSKTQIEKEFNINNLQRGFYIVKYKNTKGRNFTKKLLIN